METSKELERVETVTNIEYSRPRFWHRCMANFVDFFIFLVTGLGLFIGTRAIVQATPYYVSARNQYFDLQLASGLYVASPGDDKATIDVVYYCDTYLGVYGREYDGVSMDEESDIPKGKNGRCVYAINQFISFCHEKCSEERYNDIVSYYDDMRLNTTLDGVHYFIKDGDNIKPNPTLAEDATKSKYYYSNIFKPFIEKKCLPFLVVNVPEYKRLSRVDYNFLIFLEFPVAFFLAGILTYFVPPLFFRRGRMTLGKALYHIGLIDQRLLSPTFWRFLARFAIYFFGEMVVSMFSFGIPYIISFTMMAFSKKRQGFPDYMLGLYEVDTSKANIYLDYVEAQIKNELHGSAIDFKMKKPL